MDKEQSEALTEALNRIADGLFAIATAMVEEGDDEYPEGLSLSDVPETLNGMGSRPRR